MANQIRQGIIDIVLISKNPSYSGPALSSADIITALYFKSMKSGRVDARQ